jgi:hypothetical protein
VGTDEAPMAAQKLECAIGTCDNRTIGPRHLVRTFDLAPLQGASLLVAIPRVETLG